MYIHACISVVFIKYCNYLYQFVYVKQLYGQWIDSAIYTYIHTYIHTYIYIFILDVM